MAAHHEVDLHYECAAIGCDERVPYGRLMCYPCWGSVPRSLRGRVYNTWRTRLARPGDPAAIQAHEDAKRQAVLAVASVQGVVLEGQE